MSNSGNAMFETSQQLPTQKNKSAVKSSNGMNGRSDNKVLLLDKDVNELQFTFEMFRD